MTNRRRIVSWNVNGLRAAEKKGFSNWLDASNALVVGLQETRALPEQLPEHLRTPADWHAHFSPAERKGYSGVGIYSKKEAQSVVTRLGNSEMDQEGRLQWARIGKLQIANVYFPNGNGKDRDNSRVPFKISFYKKLFSKLKKEFDSGEPILVMGDFNTAHEEIDLARPKQNHGTSGFLPEERKELSRWLRYGWVDTFRHFEEGPGHYSWWSQRGGCREKNVGWRIDYILASPGFMPYLKSAAIHPEVMGSDHCPISVELNDKGKKDLLS